MHRIMYEEPDVSALPPSLRSVVLECLDKDPARRPSARDLLLRLVDPSAPRTPAGPPADDLVDSVPQTGPVYPSAGPTFPGHVPTQLSVPGQAPARSRRTPILVAGGAVAAAIAVLAVVLLTRGSPPASRAGSGGNSLAGSASSPAATVSQSTSPPPATSGATIPAAFAGTWKGKATMAAVGDTGLGLTNNVTFTFVAGAQTIHETDQDSYGGSCVNTLTLREATATVLTFDEPQAGGCVAGTATFTRHGASLAYRWTDNIEQNTATLRKS
jgi:serine/threonine protein kinase